MPKLPARWVESHSGEPLAKGWCGICACIIGKDQDVEWWNGYPCHESCVANEKEN